MTPSVVIFGTSGHAITHLRRARRMHDEGRIVLAGVCDIHPPREPASSLLPVEAVIASDTSTLFSRVRPDIAVIATPPHAHLPLARAALEAGCHLLLEKPPVLDLASFAELTGLAGRLGRACQAGFQSFGSQAVPALRRVLREGVIGDLAGVSAAGAWVRPDQYFARTAWAGRRRVDGQAVVDGSLTNPFAHAVATALLLNGTAEILPERTAVELYRAREIESDDTACARLSFAGAPDVVVAATLCAERDNEPYVLLHGSRGKARWHYKTDEIVVNGETVGVGPPVDLLDNLVRHVRDPAVPLVAPLASTRCFTALVEAVRDAPEPKAIPAEWVRAVGQGPERRFVVPGIDRNADTAADRMGLFSELGLPWTGAGFRACG